MTNWAIATGVISGMIIPQYTAAVTFGRGTAQFKQLIAFMAIVSLVTWAIVFITIIIRLLLCNVWYRHRHKIPAAPPT